MRLCLVILAISFTHFLSAQTLEAEQVKKANAVLNALILQRNVHEASRFYLQDFVMNTPSGAKYKDDLITELQSADFILQLSETENVEVKVHGARAVLTGVLHQQGLNKGKPFDTYSWVQDTWVNTVSGWKLLEGEERNVRRNEHL